MSVRAREISPNRSSEVAGNFLAHENFTLTMCQVRVGRYRNDLSVSFDCPLSPAKSAQIGVQKLREISFQRKFYTYGGDWEGFSLREGTERKDGTADASEFAVGSGQQERKLIWGGRRETQSMEIITSFGSFFQTTPKNVPNCHIWEKILAG